MHLEEKTVSSELAYQGRILKITKDTALLENGTEALREVVHHNGGVCVVPLTEQGEVLLVRQYRYPHHCTTLEVPAGKREQDEDILACGTRELHEEVGATADEMTYLGKLYPTPAYATEVIYMYLATGLHFSQQNLDADEFLDVVKLPLEEAIALVQRDEMPDAKTQIALMRAYLLQKK